MPRPPLCAVARRGPGRRGLLDQKQKFKSGFKKQKWSKSGDTHDLRRQIMGVLFHSPSLFHSLFHCLLFHSLSPMG